MPAAITAVHPVLMARDVADSARFYSQLGFATIFMDDPATPRYAVVVRGLVELHLQWGDPSQWEHAGDRPAYRFVAPNVDALFTEFQAAGLFTPSSSGGPWAKPGNTPWGTREFHLRDPGGNALQFYQSGSRS